MALPQIDIPAHVADEHGYNLTRGLEGLLISARESLSADASVYNAGLQTQRLKRAIEPLAAALTIGLLDAAPTRKIEAAACLDELMAIAEVAAPMSPVYGKRVAEQKMALNAAGQDPDYEEVQRSVQLDQVDHDAILAAIDAALPA